MEFDGGGNKTQKGMKLPDAASISSYSFLLTTSLPLLISTDIIMITTTREGEARKGYKQEDAK